MKGGILTFIGILGSAFSFYVGGFDQLVITLCIVITVDYISGVTVAVIFKRSPKTENGKASSVVGLKGICKKLFILLLVGVANSLDRVLGTAFIRDGLIFALLANETLSIIENAGLMGIPIPTIMKNAVELLNQKGDTK